MTEIDHRRRWVLHRIDSGMRQACKRLGQLRGHYHVHCPAFTGTGHDVLGRLMDDVEADLRALREILRTLRNYDHHARLLPRMSDNLAWLAGKAGKEETDGQVQG
jgi:hypothetical protein